MSPLLPRTQDAHRLDVAVELGHAIDLDADSTPRGFVVRLEHDHLARRSKAVERRGPELTARIERRERDFAIPDQRSHGHAADVDADRRAAPVAERELEALRSAGLHALVRLDVDVEAAEPAKALVLAVRTVIVRERSAARERDRQHPHRAEPGTSADPKNAAASTKKSAA
jgi:hypothetical protein